KEVEHWSEWHNLVDMDEFAKEELEFGSYYLYNLILISLWSTTEAKIDDITLKFILAVPRTLHRLEFSKLTAPVVEVLRMNRVQRAKHILHLYKEKINAPLKKGIGRFESVFEAIGLGGGVPDGVRRGFMEMSEIRHN